jgi:hypothetical protein
MPHVRGVSPEKHAEQKARQLLTFFSQTADPVAASLKYASVAEREDAAGPRDHWRRVQGVLRERGASVLGNPGTLITEPGPRSESNAWLIVRDHARAMRQELERGLTRDRAELIEMICDQMLAQLRHGVHANPELAIVSLGMNPPAQGDVFGSDVLAIVYQHEDDRAGDVRVHMFGGQREAKWKETRGGRGVEIYDFPSATGVYMSAEGDKRVVMQHRRGLPLVREF